MHRNNRAAALATGFLVVVAALLVIGAIAASQLSRDMVIEHYGAHGDAPEIVEYDCSPWLCDVGTDGKTIP